MRTPSLQDASAEEAAAEAEAAPAPLARASSRAQSDPSIAHLRSDCQAPLASTRRSAWQPSLLWRRGLLSVRALVAADIDARRTLSRVASASCARRALLPCSLAHASDVLLPCCNWQSRAPRSALLALNARDASRSTAPDEALADDVHLQTSTLAAHASLARAAGVSFAFDDGQRRS